MESATWKMKRKRLNRSSSSSSSSCLFYERVGSNTTPSVKKAQRQWRQPCHLNYRHENQNSGGDDFNDTTTNDGIDLREEKQKNGPQGKNVNRSQHSRSGKSSNPSPPRKRNATPSHLRYGSNRRTIEADIIQSIKSCRTVCEVDRILRDAAAVSTLFFLDESPSSFLFLIGSSFKGSTLTEKLEEESGWDDAEVDPSYEMRVGPNVASAALRKIAIVRPNGYQRHDQRKMNNRRTKRDEADNEVARRVVPGLLANIGRAVVVATRRRSEQTQLIVKNEEEEEEDGVADQDVPSSDKTFNPELSMYAIADVLFSLSKFSNRKKYKNNSYKPSGVQPLADRVCNLAMSKDDGASFIKDVGPKRLVEVLEALATLDMRHRVDLLNVIGDRLMLGDATGQLAAKELTMGLWAYTALGRVHMGLLKSFARRLRKQAIREQATGTDLVKAIWSAGRSIENMDVAASPSTLRNINKNKYEASAQIIDRDGKEEDLDLHIAMLRNEVETMCHTLTKELLKPVRKAEMRSSDNVVTDACTPPLLHSLSAGQVADILSSCATVEMSDEEPILTEICSYLIQDRTLHKSTSRDIARILWSLQRLCMNRQIETVKALGERFLYLAENGADVSCRDPKIVNTILRSAVMLHPRNRTLLDSFCEAEKIILLDRWKDQSIDDSINREGSETAASLGMEHFLTRCNEFELSNFLWFMAMAKWYDKEVIMALVDRVLEKDMIVSFSPSSASRLLWSFTTLLYLNDDCDKNDGPEQNQPSAHTVDVVMREKLFEVFHNLGGTLLSSQLTPVDASSALYAYAKASYSLDMGIFDHLADALSCDFMLERASTRQVSQALWACGRMIDWEDPLEHLQSGTYVPPPYMRSARKFAAFLASQRDKMSVKDISQTLWALGRLKISDNGILNPLASASAELVSQCNSQEISNILWGMSKVGYDNKDVVKALTDRLASQEVRWQCSSQEAATSLYALGRIKVKDENVFALLSSIMMEQLNDASAQGIANALWAYQAVKLDPPPELLDCWAQKRLGIVGLHVNNPTDLDLNVDDR